MVDSPFSPLLLGLFSLSRKMGDKKGGDEINYQQAGGILSMGYHGIPVSEGCV